MSDRKSLEQNSRGQSSLKFFSSQTGILDFLLIGVGPEAGGPESEDPGKTMVIRCLEIHSAEVACG
jgi:hypothetical protein